MKTKRAYLILFIVFLVGNISILLNINNFIYLGSSEYSDIPITHYPNLLLIKESILHHGQIPLWSDLIFSGYPFSSNPLSGLWYFPGWFALFFPLPLGINLSLLLHLFLGMVGMFLFLKQMNVSDMSALFGAIAFTFSAKSFAHIGAGHLSLIYAVSWTPWFLKTYFSSFNKNNKFYWIIPGLFLGLILLADLRWSIPFFLIWVFSIFYFGPLSKEKIQSTMLVLLTGLLASIAVWLPLLQLLPYTSRSYLSSSEQMIFSMTLVDYLNLFFPVFEGSAEVRIYPGAIVILLVVIAITLIHKQSRLKFWFLLLIISFVFSLGENFPGINLIFNLPGFSLTRVPGRFGFPLSFALIMIASITLDDLIKKPNNYSKKCSLLILFSVYVFVMIFSVGAMLVSKKISFHFIWPLIIFSLSFFWIVTFVKYHQMPKILHYIFVLLIFADLLIINDLTLRFENPDEILKQNTDLIEEIQKDTSMFRVYTPSYSVSQEEGAFWGIKQVNGVDPIQLKDYLVFFEEASGVPNKNYSVTLPPFESGNPTIDNIGYCPNLKLLEELNTKYVITSYPMNHCFDILPTKVADVYLYQISTEQNYLKYLDCKEEKTLLSSQKYSPNQIEFTTNSCGGNLQISEINYPGWNIYLDGVKSSFYPDTLLRRVYVPEGEHHIKMVYQPVLLIISVVCQTVVWLLAFGIIWNFLLRKNEKASL